MPRTIARTLAVSWLLAATAALAQSSAITISCGDCSVFQGLQVLLDGADMGANQPMRIVNVAPGKHEVKVIKWNGPFTTEALYTGVVDFPAGTELRARASKGKLDIYGSGPYTPPPPVARGPSEEQVADARAKLGEAKEYLVELKERVEDGDDDCLSRLAGRLGALEDALDDARQVTERAAVDTALGKALEAQKVLGTRCHRRNVQRWSKPLDRVVARLQGASREL